MGKRARRKLEEVQEWKEVILVDGKRWSRQIQFRGRELWMQFSAVREVWGINGLLEIERKKPPLIAPSK